MRIRRRFATLACAALFCLPSGAAFAQTEPSSWLLKYLSFYSNLGSNPPNIQEPTSIRLHGWVPYDCGGVRREAVIDQGHITLALRQISQICGDTTRTWYADFYLGYLPLGDHQLTVTRTFVNEAATDSVTESASFSFPVVDLNVEPPPPPPPYVPNWVVPYVTYGYTIPSQPNALEPTTVVLHGVFPYSCGQIVDATSDSTGLSFTMQPSLGCPVIDTVRTWSHSFPLGTLSAGHHNIHISRRFIDADSNVVAEGDWGINVWDGPNTPPYQPPGPPNFPSYQARCLSGWTTHAPPNSHTPVTLALWGWFPYYCGEVVDARVQDSHHVTLRLRPRGGACTDTVATWAMGFDLGMLPAGPNDMEVTLYVEGDPADAIVERHASFQIEVDDRDVSASVPNPFVSNTSFVVSSQKPEKNVDVGIYDLHGRRVTTLFNGSLPPGAREFRWNGNREDGSRAAIGIYFSRVAFSNRVVTRKLVMLPR